MSNLENFKKRAETCSDKGLTFREQHADSLNASTAQLMELDDIVLDRSYDYFT